MRQTVENPTVPLCEEGILKLQEGILKLQEGVSNIQKALLKIGIGMRHPSDAEKMRRRDTRRGEGGERCKPIQRVSRRGGGQNFTPRSGGPQGLSGVPYNTGSDIQTKKTSYGFHP